MNFGQNLYNWFLSNAQSLVLMAIVVIGIYLGFKREFSKLIGFLVIALIAVGLVFNAGGVKMCCWSCSTVLSGHNICVIFLPTYRQGSAALTSRTCPTTNGRSGSR